MGGRDLGPRGGEGLGEELITGGGVVTGLGLGVLGRDRKNTPDLEFPGAGADDVSRLAAVGAEASVVPAATFVEGKGTFDSPGAIHLHGGIVGAGLAGRRGQDCLGNEGEAGRGRGLGTGLSGGRLVMLNGDGSREVSLKSIGDGTSGSQLKPYNLF